MLAIARSIIYTKIESYNTSDFKIDYIYAKIESYNISVYKINYIYTMVESYNTSDYNIDYIYTKIESYNISVYKIDWIYTKIESDKTNTIIRLINNSKRRIITKLKSSILLTLSSKPAIPMPEAAPEPARPIKWPDPILLANKEAPT